MKIPNPPIKLCSEILEFLYEFSSRNKKCKLESLSKNFSLTLSYFDRALSFLVEYDLVNYVTPDVIDLSSEAKNALKKASENSLRLILEKLMEIQPFIEYTYFLGKGKTEIESIKLVSSLYNLHQGSNAIHKIFKEWIKILGINTAVNPVKNKIIEGLKESLQNKLYANNFIKEFLGDDLRNVSKQTIVELATAIKDIPNNNESSVNEAGRALEDFLRLDLVQDVDLSHCSGIGEIGNELNKHSQYPKKLNNLCLGLASVRSMGKAHGVDKTLKLSWSVTEQGALGYIIMVLSIIKSYLSFKREGKPIF